MAKKLDAERIEQARHKGEKTSSRREEQKREIQDTIARNRSGERRGRVISPERKKYILRLSSLPFGEREKIPQPFVFHFQFLYVFFFACNFVLQLRHLA